MTDIGRRWSLRMSSGAEKDLPRLPARVAPAVLEFILGPLLDNPQRVGKPLVGPQTGRYSARRGSYRVIYEIDAENHVVRVLHADHRRDVYRPD